MKIYFKYEIDLVQLKVVNMVEFLTTSGINASVQTIIRKAKQKLVLVSPYLKLPKILLERLQNADERIKEIVIVYGKDELNLNEWNNVNKLKNLSLYFYKDLHAKCYYNENSMIISSMNLHDYSIQANREMGVLIEYKEDITLYEEAEHEVQEIIRNSELVKRKIESKSIEKIEYTKKNGFCIDCKERIPLNSDKPYCYTCFMIWNFHRDPEVEESFCHQCGLIYKSTILKPLCISCYKQSIV